MIDAGILQSALAARKIPVQVQRHAEIGSTNKECARLAREGAAEGLAIIADVQTAGRGRFDRQWISPAGNLYCSLLLRPSAACEVGPFGLIASLAVLDTIEETLAARF